VWIWVALPLKKGKTCSAASVVTGETLISEAIYEYRVEGLEAIPTPAGRFKAYRISGRERIDSSSNDAGAWGPLSGTATVTDWLASINGKVTVVKPDYRNTFGELFTRELVAAELR